MSWVQIPSAPLMNRVKIELKTRKAYSGLVYEKGELLDALIKRDGKAILVGKPFIEFSPEQYVIFIPDQEYDRLLYDGREEGEDTVVG